MRVSSHGEVQRVDLAVLYRLVPAIWTEWRGLRFDRHGRLQDPDTGDTSDALLLTHGAHRVAGARYTLTPPGGKPSTFTLAADDGRTVQGTLTAAAWSVDVTLGERWNATGRLDVRTVLQANDVPGSVVALVGGREATAELLIDPAVLSGRRGDLVTGQGRAQRARAAGDLHVVTKSKDWHGTVTIHLHGRGVLGRAALVVGRPVVRRAVKQGLDEFWSDLTSESASWTADLGDLDREIVAAGSPQALVRRELWRALREGEPARRPSGATDSGSATAAPAGRSQADAPASRKRGLSRRYERPAEIEAAPAPDADLSRLLVRRQDDKVSARNRTTSQYRTPPHFSGRFTSRIGGPALVGTIRESWGNTVFSRGYLLVTVAMAAVLGLGVASWIVRGDSAGRAPFFIGLVATLLFAAMWRWFSKDRRPDFERDAAELEQSLASYLASLSASSAAQASRPNH